ncbi:MAG: sigma-54 dependent transcriptional regulator, partial [Bacteroidaceae bacterium]
AVVRSFVPQLILMDMNFTLTTDGAEGITLLKEIKIFRPEVPVILMTAWGNIQLAVQGMKAGAFDFITKPWNNATLMQRIKTVLDVSSGETQTNTTITDNDAFDRSAIIGSNPELMNILDTVKRIAHTNASVLITGESGTGKELIAEALHKNSSRSKGPFVKVNLGGISQTLFESEMFGHKKGAFTDANADMKGRFELADKGTIFLDEIGELDINCQVKLLRVLQEQTFEVLGDSHPRHVDIRVVSATNTDLQQMVQTRTFREDLFYRINLITIHLPALRERRDDIPLLIRHFADIQCSTNHLPPVNFTTDAISYLSRLPYPGNIRELKNLVDRTILLCGKSRLSADDFKSQHQQNPINTQTIATQNLTLEEIEKQTIFEALKKYSNNLSNVARALGISRTALYRRLEKYDIDIKHINR